MNTFQFYKRTNVFLTSALTPELRTSIAINKNSFDIWGNKRSSFSTLLLKIFTIITLGLFIFTSCKKDELTPSINVSNLKAGGATYYISPTGSDVTGDGSINTPWSSLYKACNSVITSGSTIHVSAGTYTESSICPLSVGVSLEGEGVAYTTVISHYSASTSYGILDLRSTVEGTNGNQHISGISFDGSNLTGQVAITVLKRSNVIIHDCNFTNFNNNAISVIGNTTWDEEPTTYSIGNAVYNCVINNCSLFASDWGRGAIMFGGQDGFLIHDNYINQTQRAASANGYCIKSASISYTKRLKIYNNTLVKLPYDGATYSFCMELWRNVGELEIYNNTLTGRIDLVSTLKGALTYGAKIYGNTVGWDVLQSDDNAAIQFEDESEYITINNNTFKNLTTGVYFTYGQMAKSYSDNIVIKNNVMTIGQLGKTDVGSGINFGGSSFTPPVSNIYIYNNVIKAQLTNGGDVGIELSFQNKASFNNIRVQNNVIQNFMNSPVRCYPTGITTTIAQLYVTNNNMLGSGNNNLPRFIGVNPTNHTIGSNISANPLFISSTDFHLQAGSPCIGAGIDVGLPYSGTFPNIGTFEITTGGGSTGSTNLSPLIQNQSFHLNENSANGTSVGFVIATDPDAGQTLTYSIISGNTNNAFAINASTGVLTVANSTTLNLTTNPTFLLIIQVQDNGTPSLNRQATITINLKSAGITTNAPPVINNQSFSLSKSVSKGAVVGTVVASDANAGQRLTYSIIEGNTNSGFAINSSTGKITVRNQYAYKYHSSLKVFQLSVKVADNGAPALSNQATISINVMSIL